MTLDTGIAKFRKIPRLNFGFYPTPAEEMPRLRAALGGGPRLFIKHDDYTGPAFGGNKVRKMEYVLAAAKAEGADTVLTVGGIRSNHARVTAALAARVGMDCQLILNGAASAGTPASMFLDELYGATVHRVESPGERAPAMQRIAGELRAKGRKPYEVPLGASIPLGAMGFVRAAEEIAQSGKFDVIFHSSSSGGTQAGLDAGLQLFNRKDTIVGVSADDSSAAVTAKVTAILDGIAEMLGVDRETLRRPVEVDDGFVGAGYGIPSAEGTEAIKLLARTEGIVLDPVYTAKAMAALIARVRAGKFTETQRILFLHTGGQLALFSADAAHI